MNKLINTFMESKKLGLSKDKCYRIHIGKGHDNCPDLAVHDSKMKEAEKEKNLGDIIDSTGHLEATIESRQKKGDSIISEILSIIHEIPMGKNKVEVALRLREAMLINGILFNSEAWHGVTAAQIAKLEKIDVDLLRSILKAHRKIPSEFLNLETGTLPIRFILAQRRINYLKHILSRDSEELIRKVYSAQKEDPTNGDFAKLVTKDLELLGFTEAELLSNNISKLKLKISATNAAFSFLQNTQTLHKKVKHIKYESMKVQEYLTSEIFSTKEANMMTALRSHCVRGIKHNFSKMYKHNMKCSLNCSAENVFEDTQEHVLYCKILNNSVQETPLIHYMYGDTYQQNQLSKKFCTLMGTREYILEPHDKEDDIMSAS
jgi:hypothetical protein